MARLFPRLFSDEKVLQWRREFRASIPEFASGKITVTRWVAERVPEVKSVGHFSEMLTGVSYKDVPEQITADEWGAAARRLTPKQVIALRAKAKELLPYITVDEFHRKYYPLANRQYITQVLFGKTHKNVPGALSAEFHKAHLRTKNPGLRKFPDEIVLFWRLIYNKGKGPNTKKIAKAYGVAPGTVASCIAGRSYRNVPEAYPQIAEKCGREPQFTEEQVTEWRRMYRTGHISTLEIAKEVGCNTQTVLSAVRGYTYKWVKEPPVLNHIKKRRGPKQSNAELAAKRAERARRRRLDKLANQSYESPSP